MTQPFIPAPPPPVGTNSTEYQTIENIYWQIMAERPATASAIASQWTRLSTFLTTAAARAREITESLSGWESPEAANAYRRRADEAVRDLEDAAETAQEIGTALADLSRVMEAGQERMEELWNEYQSTMAARDAAHANYDLSGIDEVEANSRVGRADLRYGTIGGDARATFKALWDFEAQRVRDEIESTYWEPYSRMAVATFMPTRPIDFVVHPGALGPWDPPPIPPPGVGPTTTAAVPPPGPGVDTPINALQNTVLPAEPPPAAPDLTQVENPPGTGVEPPPAAPVPAEVAPPAPPPPAPPIPPVLPPGLPPGTQPPGTGTNPPGTGAPPGAPGLEVTPPGAGITPPVPATGAPPLGVIGPPGFTPGTTPFPPGTLLPPGFRPPGPPAAGFQNQPPQASQFNPANPLPPGTIDPSTLTTSVPADAAPPPPGSTVPPNFASSIPPGMGMPPGMRMPGMPPPGAPPRPPQQNQRRAPGQPGMTGATGDPALAAGAPAGSWAPPGTGMSMPPGTGLPPGAPQQQRRQRPEAGQPGGVPSSGVPAAFAPPTTGFGSPVLGQPGSRRTRPGSAGEAPRVIRGGQRPSVGGGIPPVLANRHHTGPRPTYSQQRDLDRAARKERLERFREILKSALGKDLPVGTEPVLDARVSAAEPGPARGLELPPALRPHRPAAEPARFAWPVAPPDQATRRPVQEPAGAEPAAPDDRTAWEVETPGGPVVAGKPPARSRPEQAPGSLGGQR